jgi:GNAT superfamily N-acetyltransferase
MHESELLRLADLNLIEFWRESSKWIPNTEIVEKHETVFIDCGIDFPGCSLAFNLSQEPVEQPVEFLARAKAFFSGRKKAFSVILRGHRDQGIIQYCKDQKIFLVGDQPGMVLEGKAKGGEKPGGAELRWVNSAGDLQDFRAVAAESFLDLLFPREVSEAYFTHAERVLSPFSMLATVYFDGEPACCAMAMLSHGIGGVYWVGTTRKARGKGLAKYCVQEVSNAAIDLGARVVVLQASQFGRPVYPKIGYREFSTYPHFICSSK